MKAILHLRIVLSQQERLLDFLEVISLLGFCFKMIIFEYNIKLNTSSCFGKVCRNPRVEITLFSVLTLLQIQDSFPSESHCLKITKNFISPESSRLNLETVMSC